jgi:ATP-dependent helicase HrpB
MVQNSIQLPVDSVIAELRLALATSGSALLQAPPGSGKTTRIPLALIDEPWMAGRRVLMLEPRRLAATNAARFMAAQRQEAPGESVGYAIRYERRIGPATRLEVVTEGLLTRRLQSDPELTDVGLVIFDEFHERSLQADLALALCRDVQLGLRDDLRILVMSATLDAAPLSRLLGSCPILTAQGRSFPVSVDYLADIDAGKLAESTAQAIRQVLRATDGDILAFLPGAREIQRCRDLLLDLEADVALCPLYGNLPFAEQEAAILPGTKRRIVLATNVAETSLTIEGIESVVDSGWERRPRFDATRGMTRLDTVRISQASAEQRAGRAGRLGPGRCFRLWTHGTQGSLLPYTPPEICQADLATLAFELAQWGVRDIARLGWLDIPPHGHMTAARRLLAELGAIDEHGLMTALGREMARYPTHPRMARLLVEAVAVNRAGLGCDLVALLTERDLLTGHQSSPPSKGPSDLLERLEILHRDSSPRTAAVHRAATFWRKLTSAGQESNPEADVIGRLLACAYPDRIGLRRQPGSRRFLLRNGQGVVLSDNSVVLETEWLVAVEVAVRTEAEDEIIKASVLSRRMIENLFGQELDWCREAGWDFQSQRLAVREVRRLGAIIMQERPVAAMAADTLPAMLDVIRHRGLGILPWTDSSRQLQARVIFLHRHLAEQGWQDWTDGALMRDMGAWLAGSLIDVKSLNDLKRVDMLAALKGRLDMHRLRALDRLAPERLKVPSGSLVKIDYSAEEAPVLAVKLQEMFGLAGTPMLADGRVPVLIHLLSPAGRPLAVTRDLKSFWDTVYPEVRREMKGRYPKHPWPQNPWQAVATRRTRSSQRQA